MDRSMTIDNNNNGRSGRRLFRLLGFLTAYAVLFLVLKRQYFVKIGIGCFKYRWFAALIFFINKNTVDCRVFVFRIQQTFC